MTRKYALILSVLVPVFTIHPSKSKAEIQLLKGMALLCQKDTEEVRFHDKGIEFKGHKARIIFIRGYGLFNSPWIKTSVTANHIHIKSDKGGGGSARINTETLEAEIFWGTDDNYTCHLTSYQKVLVELRNVIIRAKKKNKI